MQKTNNNGQSKRRYLKQLASNLDQFGDNFQFKLPGNKVKHGTVLGCSLTFLLVAALLLQCYLKGATLFGFQRNMTIHSFDQNYFNSSHVFSSSSGIKFAFALVDYENNTVTSTREEQQYYGRMVAQIRSWGVKDDGKGGYQKLENLQLRVCNDSDFDAEGGFWPINDNYSQDMSILRSLLLCYDNPIEIYGHYNSIKASRLEISFEKCTGSSTCKGEKDIEDWLRRKFILVMQNQISFDTLSEHGQIIRDSSIQWFPISSQQRQELSNKIRIRSFASQNSLLGNFLDFTRVEEDGFSIEYHAVRPYQFSDNVHTAITYELDPDYHHVEMQVYNALDMLGDIGGLQYCLILIFSSLLMLLHHNKMENYLVSEMYHVVNARTLKKRMNRIGLMNGEMVDEYDNGLDPRKLNYCREFYHAKCKRSTKQESLFCLRKSRMERLFEDGRKQLLEQMDVIKLFRELRILKTIVRMKIKLTKEELDQVREQSTMMVLDRRADKENGKRKSIIEMHETQANRIFGIKARHVQNTEPNQASVEQTDNEQQQPIENQIFNHNRTEIAFFDQSLEESKHAQRKSNGNLRSDQINHRISTYFPFPTQDLSNSINDMSASEFNIIDTEQEEGIRKNIIGILTELQESTEKNQQNINSAD